MRKFTLKEITMTICALLFCSQLTYAQVVENTDTTDIGVEINGVVWATRNVDMPKKFAENPYDIGMFYQYNRNLGWSSTDPIIASDGSTTWNETYSYSQFWQPENDPCPNGWRVPSPAEFQLLVDAGESYFINDYHFNGGDCAGQIFGDYFNNNYIFLRSCCNRGVGGILYAVYYPWMLSYWSNTLEEITPEEIAFAYTLGLNTSNGLSPDNYTRFAVGATYANAGFPVRCVKEANTEESVTGVTLNKTATSLVLYDTEQLIASIIPSNATNQNVSWTSSNREIADVSIDGVITAISEGTATIIVTTQDGGHTAICDVNVTNGAGVGKVFDNTITIFPNPATDELRITNYELHLGDKIEIFDITGKLIFNFQFLNFNSIDVSVLQQGVYLLKIETDKGTKTAKFIKI